MTLGDIYRDVNSRIQSYDFRDVIYFKDIVNAINDAISLERVNKTVQGNGDIFAVTESFFVAVKDVIEYPFADTIDLSYNILPDVPVSLAIVSAAAFSKRKNNGELLSTLSDVTYEKVGGNTSVTSALTFDKSKARNYKGGNGLIYRSGDVVLNFDDGKYYKVNENYVATVSRPITDIPKSIVIRDDVEVELDQSVDTPLNENERLFTELYFSKYAYMYTTPSFVEFEKLYQLKLYNDIDGSFAFSVNKNKLYVSKNCSQFTISYIPEWIKVEDLSVELSIPYTFKPVVITRAIALLESKFGKTNVVDNRYVKAADNE